MSTLTRVPRPRSSVRGESVLRALAVVAMGVLLYGLRHELPSAVRGLSRARPEALTALGLFFVWNHVATLSWRGLLRAVGTRAPALRSLVRFRIEAQAVNQVVPAAGVAGETVRAVRAAGPGELGPAALATALDNVAGTVSGLAFALPVAIAVLVARAGGPHPPLLSGVFMAGIGLLVVLVAVELFFRFGWSWLSRPSAPKPVRSLFSGLGDRSPLVRRAFGQAVALRFVERLLAIGEVFVLFRAVGAPITLSGAGVVSAVLVVVSFAVFFVPGQLGAAEAATAAASVFLGISPTLGLSAALLRRGRQLLVCLLGMVSLLVGKHEATRGEPGDPTAEGVP